MASLKALRPSPSDGPVALALAPATLLFCLVVFGTGILLTLAAATGTFRLATLFVLLLWAAGFSGLTWRIITRGWRWVGDRADVAALAVAFVGALASGWLRHDFVSTQTDIGFYFNDAAMLAETGTRVLHGPHDRMMPGFSAAPAGGYHTSAMFGYTAFVALFGSAFGLDNMGWANAPFMLATSLCIYNVGRALGARSGAVVAQLLYTFCLVPLYMSRWIMTENAAVATFWCAAWISMALREGFRPGKLAVLALALAYGCLVRPEGILVLGWFSLVLFIAYRRPFFEFSQRFLVEPAQRRRTVIALAVVTLTLVAAVILLAPAFPKDYLVSGVEVSVQVLQGRAAADAPDVPTNGPQPNWGDYAWRYEWDSTRAYYLEWFAAAGLLGVALGLVPRRRAGFLALLTLPYVLFVLMPPVTTAHPWFMRRLWITYIPLALVLAGASLDLPKLARRWPLRGRRGNHARAAPVFAGAAVLVVLAALTLDVSGPILARQESDGIGQMMPRLLDALPAGSAVLVDEEAVGASFMLRLQHGDRVVPWFNRRSGSFIESVLAAEAAERTFVLRHAEAPVPVRLRAPFGENTSSTVFDVIVERTARADFRQYISRPPLPDGYEPLRLYLKQAVPPNDWVRLPAQFTLEEIPAPGMIEKGIQFVPGDWERTPQGMRALRDNASLEIPRASYVPHLLESLPLSLYLAYVQLDAAAIPVEGQSAEGDVELARLDSDASVTIRFAAIPLPSPMRLDAVSLPAGTVLRGAYFGPTD